MADSVAWQIMEEIKTRITADLTFARQGNDPIKVIQDSAVVIRDPDDPMDETQESLQKEELPGVHIKLFDDVHNPQGGTNLSDEHHYFIAVEFLSRGLAQKFENLETHLKWVEQIRKLLQSRTLANVQNAEGRVVITNARRIRYNQQTRWKKHRLFRAGIELEVESWEDRGVTT